ncbi:hypothetical protein, partial [Agrobacterium arsenijevicii]|uniref:hypothetical protein n=1 Tax=Agrobacterium arsenijevicii TaxID=1585697 RepID=UPI00330637EC
RIQQYKNHNVNDYILVDECVHTRRMNKKGERTNAVQRSNLTSPNNLYHRVRTRSECASLSKQLEANLKIQRSVLHPSINAALKGN